MKIAVLGKDPAFDIPFATVTAKVRDTVTLYCSIDYLGKFKVHSTF